MGCSSSKDIKKKSNKETKIEQGSDQLKILQENLLHWENKEWKINYFILKEGKLVCFPKKENDKKIKEDDKISEITLKNSYYKYYEDNYTDEDMNRLETEEPSTEPKIVPEHDASGNNLINIIVVTQGNECKNFILQLPSDPEKKNEWISLLDAQINYYSIPVPGADNEEIIAKESSNQSDSVTI